PPVVILSHAVWERRFGGDPNILGQPVDLGGVSHLVIGIAPEDFSGLFRGILPDFWIPLTDASTQVAALEDRSNPQVGVVGRLLPGVTVMQARAAAETIARGLAAAYPETNKDRRVSVIAGSDLPIHPAVSRRTLTTASLALMAQTGLILLIACANIANLFLARATQRRREIAIRLSLGASRGRLLRQLLTESTVLSLVGGGVALMLAGWLMQLLNTVRLPLPVQIGLGLHVNASVVAFTVGLSLVAGTILG